LRKGRRAGGPILIKTFGGNCAIHKKVVKKNETKALREKEGKGF